MARREDTLVPVAEFAVRELAEDTWAMLSDAGIPASVVRDPGALGTTPVTRVLVARRDAAEAQRLIAESVDP